MRNSINKAVAYFLLVFCMMSNSYALNLYIYNMWNNKVKVITSGESIRELIFEPNAGGTYPPKGTPYNIEVYYYTPAGHEQLIPGCVYIGVAEDDMQMKLTLDPKAPSVPVCSFHKFV